MELMFFLIWLASGAGSILIAAAAYTYIRRTWQQIRADEEDSPHERILDGIDHMNIRLHGINERLVELDERMARLERRIPEGVVLARIAGPRTEEPKGASGLDPAPHTDVEDPEEIA